MTDNTDLLVDELDQAYEDGREDLGQKIAELIQQFQAEDVDPAEALDALVGFIEGELGWDGYQEDDSE